MKKQLQKGISIASLLARGATKTPVKTPAKIPTDSEIRKQKLKLPNSYLTGLDYFNCVNSGASPCILHLRVNERSYYIVGQDGVVLDSLIEKTIRKIKAQILAGNVSDYKSSCGKVVRVFSKFSAAEKYYVSLNEEIRQYNDNTRQKIAEIRQRIANGTATMEDYFELGDHAVI